MTRKRAHHRLDTARWNRLAFLSYGMLVAYILYGALAALDLLPMLGDGSTSKLHRFALAVFFFSIVASFTSWNTMWPRNYDFGHRRDTTPLWLRVGRGVSIACLILSVVLLAIS